MTLILSGTDGLSDVDGSAATPAIRGTDANTGIFFPAADTIAFSEGGVESMRIDSAGNMGLGVTPSAWNSAYKSLNINTRGFCIAGASDAGTISVNSFFDSGSLWKYKGTSSVRVTRYDQYDGSHSWYNAAAGTAGNTVSFTQAMTLDSNGNLMVGITSAYLTSRVTIESANSNNARITQNIYNSAATSTTKAANTIVRISSNGFGADCCIQVTDNVANNYYFGGNNAGAYVVANSNGVRLSNGGTSWAADSDERIKDIIEPITDGLNKVNSLRSVIGKYKTDDEDKRRVFLIAQDVQAVLPEAVFENEDTLMLQYTDVIPLLVSAVKDLKAELDTVKAELATLKG